MHKFVIILFLIFLPFSLYSQLLPGEQKLSDEEDTEGRYYGEFGFQGARMLNQWGGEIGLSIAFRIQGELYLSINYYGLLTRNVNVSDTVIGAGRPFLRLSHFGIEPAYFIRPLSWAEFSFSLLGALAHTSYSSNINFDIHDDPEGDWLFIFQPSTRINIRINESIWTGIKFGYRISNEIESGLLTGKNLNGEVAGLYFKFVF
ncbi:MAG: hypothetical protein ACLFR2_04730 [Candidatus Kapaibacterium sp.]